MSKPVIHGQEDFEGMRKAGKLASQVLDYITPYVEEGVTTLKLDDLCHAYIIEHGAKAACLGYKGYPKTICTSVNHVICHGIPSADKILKSGDILNIDVTVILDGWYGDTSRMYCVGKVSKLAKRLCDVTYDCMMYGIETVKPGSHVGDIGYAIQTHAEAQGFSVVRDFCGHGLGRVFHMPPSIVHYGKKGQGQRLEEGMFFTVEPMINAGAYESKVLADGWTAVTRDKSLSAQWEHSLGVTANGYEIFTLS